jgi:hypothetical protein
MPIGWAMGGSALLGFLGAGQQASAAQSAAQQQSDAARYAADLQQKQFEQIQQQQAPYREAGYSALNQIGQQLPYFTHQATAEDLKAMPGFTFGLEQGVGAGQQTANVGGGGSNITRGAQKFAEDYATNVGLPQYISQRQGIYNTLAGIAGIGQTGQSQVNQAGMNTAANMGSAASAGAGYGAAGTIGSANAYSGALSNLGNAGMMYGLMNKPSGGMGSSDVNSAINSFFTPSGG